MTPAPQMRLVVRLTASEQAALATVAHKITTPIRRPTSQSDAMRAALLFAAANMPGTSASA